jgi:hypothetical protein
MSSRRRRVWSVVLGGAAVVCALGACTFSLPGGLIGGILALLLAGGLLFGAGASQSGCESFSACLSPTDSLIGPCLEPPLPDAGRDARVGPCLSPPLGDAALDTRIGPCLEPPLPDAGQDGPVGPCLAPLPPDAASEGPVGPCLDPLPPDAGKDGPVGPCLSPPALPLDAGHAAAVLPPTPHAPAPPVARRALLATLEEQGRLPADVVARLKRGQGAS